MLIKKPADIKSAEITPKEMYLNRRQFMTSASAMALSAGVAATGLDWFQLPSNARAAEKLANVKKSSYNTKEKQNSFKDITTYNNFYELGVDKGDPAQNAKYLTTKPWTVASKAKSKRPRRSTSMSLMKLSPLEERIYRLRCVEAWSMVIPWIGFPLSALIKSSNPPTTPSSFNLSRCKIPSACPGRSRDCSAACSNGPTSKGCAWTKRCIRSRFLEWVFTVKSCRRKTARRFACRTVEVRFQKHQVDRQSALRRETTAGVVEHHAAARVRLLLQRQSGSRPSALEPSHRKTHRRIFAPQNSYVQRLWRPGRELI